MGGGLSKKQTARVTAGIRCRGRGCLHGSGSSSSQDVMSATARPAYEWKDLPWRAIERRVFKLQRRIFQASGRGDVRTVHRLQRLLTHSWSGKCLAVRRVSQD